MAETPQYNNLQTQTQVFFQASWQEINDRLQSLVIIPYLLPLSPGKMGDIETKRKEEKLHSKPPPPLGKRL